MSHPRPPSSLPPGPIVPPTRRLLLALLTPSLLAACGDDAVAPVPGAPGIHITGDVVADTALATVAQPLVVQVFDARGRPAVGVRVRFDAPELRRVVTTDAGTFEGAGPSVFLRDSAAPVMRRFLEGTTDRRGVARAWLVLGYFATDAEVHISVPSLGYADTAHYTVRPGAAQGIVLTPGDTALLAGASHPVQAVARDRNGNLRPDDVVSLALQGDAITLAQGSITAARHGRAAIAARVGTIVDTTWVSVVPAATLAAHYAASGEPLHVVTLGSDLTGRRQLLDAPVGTVGAQAPAWRPGRDEFVAHGGGVEPRLYAVTLDGQHRRLTPAATPLQGEYWPQFTRDGAWVYFGGRPGHQNGELWRVRPDGTGAERVGPAADFYAIDSHPSPSPDGSRVAYYTNRDAGVSSLRVLDVATGTWTRLPAVGTMPRWSPDGAWIAFHDAAALWVIRPDGTDRRRVSPVGTTFDMGASWSPDGRWLVGSGPAGLSFIEVATGLVIPVPRTHRLTMPAWRP